VGEDGRDKRASERARERERGGGEGGKWQMEAGEKSRGGRKGERGEVRDPGE